MIKHDNQMFPSLSAIKCWWRRDLRSWIVGVLLCECLYLHGAAANICTWWMFWQLPTFSRNIILRASTRGPWTGISKNETNNDRPTYISRNRLWRKAAKSALLAFRISFSTVFMIFPSPSVFHALNKSRKNRTYSWHTMDALHKDTKLEQCYLCTRFDHCKEVFLDLL